MATIDIQKELFEQAKRIRDQLLNRQKWSPTKPISSNPDLSYKQKNTIIYFFYLLLAKKNRVVADKKTEKYYNKTVPSVTQENQNKVKKQAFEINQSTNEYYETDVTEKRNELINNSGIILDGKEVDKGENPYPFKNQEPVVHLPDNVKNIYAQNAALEESKREWHQWKKDLKPFIGSNRIYNYPEPDELPHVKDQTVANKKKYILQNTLGETETQIVYKSWVPSSYWGATGTPEKPMSSLINEKLKSSNFKLGSVKFFIEKLHGRGTTGPFKKGPIKSGLTAVDLPNRMLFPAYLAETNDSFSNEWSSYSFIGRGEDFGAYKNTTRTLSLSFWVLSDYSSRLLINAAQTIENNRIQNSLGSAGFNGQKLNNNKKTANIPPKIKDASGKIFKSLDDIEKDEKDIADEILKANVDWGSGIYPNYQQTTKGKLGYVPNYTTGTPEQLYERATFLAQCNYAWYRKDGKMKEQPMIRLRVGDWYDVIGYIESMDFNMDDFEMDLNPSDIGAIPLGFKCTIKMTILHENEPSSEYRGFYHRADRDVVNKNQQENGASELSINKDEVLDNLTSGSPIKSKGLPKTSPNSMSAESIAFQESFKFNGIDLSSVNQLKNLDDVKYDKNKIVKKQTLVRALKASAKLNSVNQLFNINKIPNLSADIVGSVTNQDDKSLSNSKVKSPITKENIKHKKVEGNQPQPLFPKFKR